jgi:hypothetical protein
MFMRIVPLLILLAAACKSRVASAEPQVSVALTIGGGAREHRGALQPAFHLGAIADLLFLRKRDSEMAFGPYLQVDTLALDQLNLGGGVSWLLPLGSPVVIFSAGALARKTEAWSPAVQTRLFFGARSYNFHSLYGFALGGFLQARFELGSPGQAELICGAQLDLAILGLPFVLAYQALRGRPPTFR